MKNLLVIALITIAALAGASAASAQTPETPKGEVFAGYSAAFFDVGHEDADAVHGFDVAATGNLSDWFGVTGEVSGHYEGGGSVHYILGGPKFTFRNESRVEPYAHVLVGTALFDSSPYFALAAGGGVDVRVNDKFAVRAVQVDYAPVINSGSVLHTVRVSSGVVFRF